MKSNWKKRMLAVVLCMVIALSNSSFIFASTGTEEPAAVAQEGDPQNVQEAQTEAAVQDTPAVLSETTPEATPEATPEPTQVPEVTAEPTEAPQATAEPTQAPEATPVPTETPAVTAAPTQAPEITPTPTPEVTAAPETTPEATPVPTEAPVTYNEAVELKHEFKDENGNVTATVTAQIPAGAFQADASELTMEVTVPDQATTEHVKKLMEESLPEHYMLGDTVLYDIRFKVNGTETESQQPIVITFENQNGITVKDVKKAVVFQLDPADPAVEGDKDELVTITQRNDMIESLQNSGQSTDNVDDYDLSEITLKEDGTSNKIQMEGRTSTIYGCYAYYEPVQVLTYEDDQVTVTVSADAGIIPQGAKLKVTPIEKTEITDEMTQEEKKEAESINEQYDLTEKKLTEDSEDKNETLEGFLAYDISFLVNGEEVEPDGNVNVSLDFKQAVIPEGVSEDSEVIVKHLKEDVESEDGVSVEKMTDTSDVDIADETAVKKVELTTDTFSIFTITWIKKQYTVTVHYVNEKFQAITDTSVQKENISVTGTQEISLSDYKKAITGYQYEKSVIGKNTETICDAIRIDDSGELQYHGNFYWGDDWKSWDSSLGYDIYLVYTTKTNTAIIETVDNQKEYITINLFNYDVGNYNGDEESEYVYDYLGNKVAKGGYKKGINEGHLFKFLSDAPNQSTPLDSINQWTGDNTVRPNIVRNTLDNDGYPVLNKDSQSLAYLFNDNVVWGKEVYEDTNYLLTKDEKGYFSFNSDENYAEFDKYNKTFTVYSNPYSDQSVGKFNGLKGFYPFDSFSTVANSYLNGSTGNALFSSGWGLNPNYADHYFGMTMSATFFQPKDGKINGEDMVFEFSGDDDVWVFIDNTLVLDLGGIHDRASGSINFAKGTVEVNGKQTANMFRLLDVSGFEDYSTHTIKFFYLERGNNASNCKLLFNLPTIPEDSVIVTKEVTDEDGNALNYAKNINFEFNIKKNGVAYSNQSYEVHDSETNELIATKTTDETGNFTLKDGQMAVFPEFKATDKFEVKELGANLEDGYEVEINDQNVNISKGETEEGSVTLDTATTGEIGIEQYSTARFHNEVKDTGILSIKKEIEPNSKNALDDTNFSMYVQINGEVYTGEYTLIKGETKTSMSTENGIITLKGGEEAQISGLPYGTTFQVKEENGQGYYGTYKLAGEYYEAKIPNYDDDNFITNGISDVFAKIAGDCIVTVTNQVVNGGTTSVQVNKTWDENIVKEDYKEVTVTLYEGTKESGKQVECSENPSKLNADNNWSKSWDDLSGDREYYIQETATGFKNEITDSYEFTLGLGSIKWKNSTSNTNYFSLGSNGIVAIQIENQWLIWTSEEIPEESRKELIRSLNDGRSENLISANAIFVFGNQAWNEKLKFDYQNGTLETTYTGDNKAFVFGYGTYNKKITFDVKNSIDNSATISIPVEKRWEDGNSSDSRPNSVTVQLYQKIGDQETSVEYALELTSENEWKGSFNNLPYWFENERIEYYVKEVKVGDDPIESSGYQSNVSGNADQGFVITNKLLWQIAKISSTTKTDGSKIYLGGAQFTAVDSEQNKTYYGISANETGVVQWYDNQQHTVGSEIGTMLSDGQYTITETKAPSGYVIEKESWTIEVVNGYPVANQEWTAKKVNNVYTFFCENPPLYDLPSAGGSGIFWYLISGTAFLMAASLILYRMKRKGVLGR